MRIPLKYKDLKHKFTLLIEAYNPVLRLKKREKEVLLGYLLEYRELVTKGLTEDQIKAELFSTTVRQKLRNDIKMSEPSYNNHIHQLKNKGVLVEGELLKLLRLVIKQGDFDVEYNIING